jgi:MFS family permease
LLTFGNGLSNAGDQMEFLARGWLVLELTDSPLALGFILFVQGLPRLFLGLAAGTLADRFDRRTMLVISNIICMCSSFAFATLTATGLIEMWQVAVFAMLTAAFGTLNLITRQALLPDIVSRQNLGNAIALNASVRATVQIVSQSVAGLMIAFMGVAGVLYFNAASFLAMLIALYMMRIPRAPAATRGLGLHKDILQGFEYVWRSRDLLAFMILSLLPFMLIVPYRTFLPVFARDVWSVGAVGYGIMMASPGIGALLASAGYAAVNPQRQGLILLVSVLAVGAALAAFALSPTFILGLVMVTLVGVSFNIYRIASNTVIQLHTPREMMGRVLGIYNMDRALQPVGGLLIGVLSAGFGTPLAMATAGIACVVLTIVAIFARPSLRHM